MKMFLKVIILLLMCSKYSIGQSTHDSIYTIVCENSLLAGERFRIYVTIYNGSQPVELRVTLNHTTLKQNPTEIQRFLTIDPHKGFSLDIDIPSHWKDGYYNLQILGSGGVNFTHERELHLINHVQHFIIKIMVDKEVYSIGDRVRFSTLIIDERGRTIKDGEVINVTVSNKQGNTIQQWLNAPTRRGVFGAEMQLDRNCHEGEHLIIVNYKGVVNKYPFYVPDQSMYLFFFSILPIPPVSLVFNVFVGTSFIIGIYLLENSVFFDVEIKAPASINLNYSLMSATVYATYKSGKNVSGSLTLKFYGKYCIHNQDCGPWEILADKPIHGAIDIVIPLPNYLGSIDWVLEATVTDHLTDRVRQTVKLLKFQEFKNAIQINLFQQYFASGLPFKFQVESKEQIIKEKTIKIRIRYTLEDTEESRQSEEVQEFILSPENYKISVTITVPFNAISLLIQVEANNSIIATSKALRAPYNAVDQAITIVVDETRLKVGSNVTADVYSTVELSALSYVLISIRSYEIIQSGTLVTKSSQGPHQVSFAVGPEAVTHVYLLVYGVTHDGILVADSKVFITNRDNAVEINLTIEPLVVEPGALVNFTVESSPETLLFLKSTDTVLSQLFEKFYDPLTWLLTSDPEWSHWKDLEHNELNLIQWHIGYANSSHKQTSLFRVPRLRLFTNAILQKEEILNQTFYHSPPDDSNILTEHVSNQRKDFSPVWLWRNMTMSSNGKITFTAQAPDRISTWHSLIYGIDNEYRIGQTTGPVVTVDKPLYALLDVPPFATRSEAVIIRVLVFQQANQRVNVTLISRDQRFQILHDKTHKLLSNESVTNEIPISEDGRLAHAVSFLISPLYTGTLDLEALVMNEAKDLNDTVIRRFKVKEAPVDLKPLIYDAKEALRHGEEICLRPNLIFKPGEASQRLNISFQVNSMNDEFGNLRVNACIQYVHKENADIILEVQLPSGFEFLEFANKNIYHQPFNHYEVSDNNSKIKWFFYKVPSHFICAATVAKRTFIVYNLQPAKVIAYTSLDLSKAKRARVYYRAPSFEGIF